MSHSQKLKILVCDADNRILQRLSSWIKAMGEEVFIFDDAINAKEMFIELKPDILLVSQELKNMGPIEFIDSIKSINPSQAVILMLNSDADNNIFKRSIDLKVDKYLNMPVDASVLFSTIEALSQEKIWHEEFRSQKRLLQDYKDALDLSFSVSRHDINGKIIYVNDLFCTTSKIRYVDAMKGLINPLENSNEDMQIVWDALKTDFIYRDRQIFKIENTEDHIIDITAVALFDDSDKVYEYLVFSNDVTEVINASRKLKVQEIDKRIQKLAHAKELNKMKDSFLTVFSHELKTPLNSIINFSEYIKKHLLKEDFKKRDVLVEQVSEINTSGWNMLDMITNLLDSMKLRDGEIDLSKSDFLLHKAVDEILLKYVHDLESIKVTKILPNNCIINNDRKRVLQIIDNLISNAIKYSKNNIAITLKTNASVFVFEIIDDGAGFEDTSKVFELFSQSNEDNMTRTAQGTGVGLFVVKKLCDAMNYSITLASSKQLGGARVIIKGEVKV